MITYCESTCQTIRRKTKEVLVGSVKVGGENPIRIQSMATQKTADVPACVLQIMRLADAGCEIARVTVQGKKEAIACEAIKNSLVSKGYDIPLVADIHFYPPAAMLAAQFVDKIRINPGNYTDPRASFKKIDCDDAFYAKELLRIEEEFLPLIELCKRLKKSMRIGVNHGSLSDRIMSRYGNSPIGMVESALEFTRICRKYDYHDLIFSMKSSNPSVMIEAYRLLCAKMLSLGWDYPFHLGVTEAGEGEDGRLKSSIGIGALLLDGIGDTIRVSLTEDPCNEIAPCRELVSFAENHCRKKTLPFIEKHRDFQDIKSPVLQRPFHSDGCVILKVAAEEFFSPTFLSDLDCEGAQEGAVVKKKGAPDALMFEQIPDSPLIEQLTMAGIQVLDISSVRKMRSSSRSLGDLPDWIFFEPKDSVLHETRRLADALKEQNASVPIVLSASYSGSFEKTMICAGAEIGALLCDRLIDGVCIDAPIPLAARRKLSFNLLQSARMRMTKTDYISCPGCGRTLFDLQETSRRIRSQTAHLSGVKIAIMGCIVNGPGEMADADFGYVGSKSGKINLYVGKICVEKDIDESEADQKLIELIKSNGKWQPANS